MYLAGIDIGGTFTDLVFFDETTGNFVTQKVLTSSHQPHLSVLEGFEAVLSRDGLSPDRVRHITHATTLASNAIIERRGAKTALIATRGFKDVLHIGRWKRPLAYDLFYEQAEPLLPRRLCYEATERVAADGRVVTPLCEDDVRLVLKDLQRQGATAVAICFLHSFRNRDHERRAAEIVRAEAPHLSISMSSEVAPEIREYERTSTTVANAYLQSVMSRYLSHLTQGLEARGFEGKLFVMLSGGGITTAETAARFPVRVVESGPAAGTMAAAFLGTLAGEKQVLSLDMGGTTAKICLINEGRPLLAADMEVARTYRFRKGTGIPLKIPCVELVEIGAGGGSIAHIDRYGLLRVGPQSAESEPGPACYGRGGEEPTVTDADLILGYLNRDYFLGGRMLLDEKNARDALLNRVAAPLGITLEAAASGIYQVVNSSMASATRVYAAEKGADLRNYLLLAFGGAGPVHACAVAEQLGITSVTIPFGAGLASAFGLLVTPPAFDFAQSYMGVLGELDWGAVRGIYERMEEQGRALLKEMGLQKTEIAVARTADMRYAGQSYEITVSLPDGNFLEAGYEKRVREAFHEEYEKLYRQAHRDFAVEALMWRASIRGPRPQMNPASFHAGGAPSARKPLKGKRQAFFPELTTTSECTVFDRYSLEEGFTFAGPAIVEEVECTTLVRPGWTARVDRHRNLVLKKVSGKEAVL